MRGGLAIIPNGVSIPTAVDPSCEQPNRLLIDGTLAYPPNQDAQEKALVATRFAPAGLGLDSGKHYVAADSASDLARACTELLANPERRRTLVTAGRAYVVEHFDWNRIEESIADLVPSGK